MKYKNLDIDARKRMFISTLIGSLMFVLVIGIILYYFIDEISINKTMFNLILIGGLGLLLLNLFIAPYFRYKRYRYLITSDKVEVIEGYIFIKRDIVPIDRIHKITLERGPVDNLYKLANVALTTAGGVVTIKYLKIKEAEMIADNLKDVVNELVV